MLALKIEKSEFFDSETREFLNVPETEINLEHSLVSLSKWEEIWEVPFLNNNEKSKEQILSYVQCMILTPGISSDILRALSSDQYDQINTYISAKRTATTFSNHIQQKSSNEFVTAELIYYWMVALQIPFQPTETWHLNKLLTLIKVVNLKNTPPKKMSRSEILAKQRQMNASRRARYGTNG